jgi:hypothetical protein
MRARRRNRGFEASGKFPVRQLGLPARRAGELELGRAWAAVVGETMAHRVRPLKLRRGVIEIEIESMQHVEKTALLEMLPRLTGRLAAAQPQLGIRRFRVREAGSDRSTPSCEIRAPDETEPGSAATPRLPDGPEDSEGLLPAEAVPDDALTRLRRVMDNYLRRSSRQKP